MSQMLQEGGVMRINYGALLALDWCKDARAAQEEDFLAPLLVS